MFTGRTELWRDISPDVALDIASQQRIAEIVPLSKSGWFSSTPEGSGTNLPKAVLLLATISAALSTVLSLWTVWLQLKNYRKIALQRFVVRILIMYVTW
jgi:hypothetical protein